MSTFVSVGNALQPFTRLLEGVSRIAAQLPQPVVVQHGHTPFSDHACQLVPFLGMEEFIRHIHSADLLIMHAGAGSVIHAIEAGKVPVVMPRRAAFGEHVNDHQVELAQALAETGKVVAAERPEDLGKAIRVAQECQSELRRTPGAGSAANVEPHMVKLLRQVLAEYAQAVDRSG